MPFIHEKDGTISIVESTIDNIREIKCAYNAINKKIKHMQNTATPATRGTASYYLGLISKKCAALSYQYLHAAGDQGLHNGKPNDGGKNE